LRHVKQTPISAHYEQLLGLTFPWVVSEVDVDTEQMELTIHVIWTPGNKAPCPECNEPCTLQDHREERRWRHLDTMQFATVIVCCVPRAHCPTHGDKTIRAPWAEPHSRFTALFERFAIDVIFAAKNLTRAKQLLRLSWDQLQRVQEQAVARGLARRCEDVIPHVGMDEKSFRKGHNYVSVLTDIDQGRVIDLVEERTTEAAKTLWNALTDKQKTGVEAVAMDMWDAFMKAAREVVPQADIVHDKYHVASYLGKAVDLVRRGEHRALTHEGSSTLAGTKYLWLRNKMSWSTEEKQTFRSLAVDALKVGRAWAMKEMFQKLWNYTYVGSATAFFKRWFFWATHSRLKPMIAVAKTLQRHLTGILAYLKHHITNAVTEGLNSKIQSIKANARGFRNFQHYRVAILFHCGKLSLYP